MALDAEGTNVAARAGQNGQEPRCDHIDLLPAVEPGKRECVQCLALGRPWTRLLMCLTCGWVACSDKSHGGHARAHYQETDHPVAAALEPRSAWRWCYVHRRTV
ncbi:UBP-type zinc finger domain-containing protein [Nonomuraea roseoviolacea subsp. roseoviolacea]|uniref:UBP type Zn finger protein n=1 Tax=Nonomuraea roseoviolacea subsp. carminata TaxID=160689 RepID=A0ABT1K9J1_9ACTN|nr:UBP-type zinc finger domain-containing protein [Nonomuraea roseoviolacea]MCP2350688.1 putative UBP type Zn finger protein [Nonomuraea roseoviolacea subsp. carminata]